MSSLRITQNSMNRTQLSGLNTSLSRLQHTQEGLTSGKRLNRPSDNPVDTVSALRLRGEQRQLEQQAENITDGLSRLRLADDALTRATPMIQRVRQLVVAGANGVNSQAQLDAFATEVAQLKQGLTQVGNTQYAGRAVFAGTANVDQAFDPATGEFKGNNLPVLRQVTSAPGAAGQVNVAVDGETAFTTLLRDAGPGGPAGIVDRVAAAMQAGDHTALVNELGRLDVAMDALLAAQSTVGARTNRLDSIAELNGRQDDSTRIALSKVEDVDFMKAAMDMSIQSNAYEAALAASAKVLQPSLMDFLR